MHLYIYIYRERDALYIYIYIYIYKYLGDVGGILKKVWGGSGGVPSLLSSRSFLGPNLPWLPSLLSDRSLLASPRG